MTSRRFSASTQSDTPQRRGGARFPGALVEPSHAASILQRSPVNTAAAASLKPPHSTPQPPRRTLFARLFRKNNGRNPRAAFDGDDQDASLSAAASPASHVSTPTPTHRLLFPSRAAPTLNHTASDRQLLANAVDSDDSDVGSKPVRSKPVQQGRVLMEGELTKLSSHRFLPTSVSYFVLEESVSAMEPRSRICLKQYCAKPPTNDAVLASNLLLAVVVLSELDQVTDDSDWYTKYGIELRHRRRATAQDPDANTNRLSSEEEMVDKEEEMVEGEEEVVDALERGEPLTVLRLKTEDASAHRKWLRALGSAVGRLADQAKRHYPITPADVHHFAREHHHTTVFEPQAVNTIVATAVRGKSVAKVAPMVCDCEEEMKEEEENQREEEDCGGGGERAEEMRGPEEPETQHTEDDHDEPEASVSGSDAFSDAWRSPHADNNHDGDDDNNDGWDNQRSSNQVDESDDEERRLSSRFESSHSGTNSVASTPSPFARTKTIGADDDAEEKEEEEDDDEEIRRVAASMAASSIEPGDTDLGTPLSSPSGPPPPSPSPPPPPPPPLPQQASMLSFSRLDKTGATHLGSALRPKVHSFSANGQVFTLDVRYELLKSIGNGAYGAVIAVKDSLTDTSLAVKKITNIFDDLVDAKRILREVRLLRHFHHKNITALLDLAPPLAKKAFDDMYIITELMETDLHQVIYSMQPMSDDHVKYFLYQMLCALYHIHSAGVIHRDMKPSNILLNSNCDLKVCDFGLARGGMDADADARRVSAGAANELTEYVVTRWYRAPEIMLNCLQYTAAVDVWAVGCIFAEMLLREPLFPGNDYIHQLKLIIKFLGTPKQEDTAFVKNAKALRFLTKLSISKPRKWREVFTGEDVNPLALDLLAQMLIFNPEKRISVEKALQHPYLSTFYDPADIGRAQPFEFGFDLPDGKLTREALVDLLCEDMACFHPALMYQMKQPPLPMPMVPRPPMAHPNGSSRHFYTASAS